MCIIRSQSKFPGLALVLTGFAVLLAGFVTCQAVRRSESIARALSRPAPQPADTAGRRPFDTSSAEGCMNLALDHFCFGGKDSTVTLLRRAILKNPTWSEPWRWMGLTFGESALGLERASFFDDAARLQDTAVVYYNRAVENARRAQDDPAARRAMQLRQGAIDNRARVLQRKELQAAQSWQEALAKLQMGLGAVIVIVGVLRLVLARDVFLPRMRDDDRK